MRRILRRKGVQGFIRAVGRRVCHSADKLFYVRALTKPVDGYQPLPHLHVRRFAAATDEFSAIYRTFTDNTTVTARITERMFCDVAFVDDDPAAFLWTTVGDSEIRSLNAILRLAPRDAYLMEVYTQPAHRRKGIAMFLRSSVGKELTALGYTRLFGLTDLRNRPMVQLAEKTGFVPYYRISMRRLAPVERLIPASCRPEYEGGLRVEQIGWGLLPFRRPRWALTVTRPGMGTP